MSKGLFNIDGFDQMVESSEIKLNNDLLDMSINEEGEMGPKPDGGLSEYPSSKPYDTSSITVPKNSEISEEAYNKAICQLQKSFKEAYEVTNMLLGANVITESQRLQEEFTNKAIIESYENGPIFEAVQRSDKKAVKKIVNNLRDKLEDRLEEDGVRFKVPRVWVEIIGSVLSPIRLGRTVATIWTKRLWQILGICYVEEGNITKLCDDLTKEFKEELGDYKIIYSMTIATLADMFRKKFNWKNDKNVYLLIVDKKLPNEINKMQEDIADAIKAARAEDEEAKDKKDK